MASRPEPVALFLCGDVMTGRGIDQILPHPCEPELFEPYVEDAREYVAIAEARTGPIRRPVEPAYIWGDALAPLLARPLDARVINLETAVTRSPDHWRGKGINYRMNPANIGCLTAAGIECCVLANNHVLDWGYDGLVETLDTLRAARIHTAGAGMDIAQAAAPAVLAGRGGARILVFAFGTTSSGILPEWAAGADRPGVHLLPDLSERTLGRIGGLVRAHARPGDVVVASIHWGGNWGYEVHRDERAFARGLVERAGVHVVHGHSSHHVKSIEVFRGRLILYGCGDLLTDYEGISGHEAFRGDLGLLYFPTVDPSTGALVALEMVPTQNRHLRLERAPREGVLWLAQLIDRIGWRFGTRVRVHPDDRLTLEWIPSPEDRP
jgi:poly-gamma-glutamate synthesis protein (capsule biosynthesis protein)